MDSEIFFNEFGNEPFSYIGYVHPRFELEFSGNAIHKHYSSDRIDLIDLLRLQDASHKVKSSAIDLYITPRYTLDIQSSKHSNTSTEPSVWIRPRFTIVAKPNIHKHYSPLVALSIKQTVHASSAIHKLGSSSVPLMFILTIPSARHSLLTSNKINAPVNFECGYYLDTPYEDRYLDTLRSTCK